MNASLVPSVRMLKTKPSKLTLKPKKAAPISLITNSTSLFIKPKTNNIASSYKENSTHINHCKKQSNVSQKRIYHTKNNTNIFSSINESLGISSNNKSLVAHKRIVSPKNNISFLNVNNINNKIQNNLKHNVNLMQRLKKNMSISKTNHNSLSKQHKSIGSTFCTYNTNNTTNSNKHNNLYKNNNNKTFRISTANNTLRTVNNTRRNSNHHSVLSSSHKERVVKVQSNKKVISVDNKQHHRVSTSNHNEILSNQSNKKRKHKQKYSKGNIGHSQKMLEIKTNININENLKGKIHMITSRLKQNMININTYTANTSLLNKERSKDIKSIKSIKHSKEEISLNNNNNKTKQMKMPPKKEQIQKIKHPLRLDLTGIINENKVLSKEFKIKHINPNIVINNNTSFSHVSIDSNTLENVLDNKIVFDKKYNEYDNFDDLNAIIRKIDFDKGCDNYIFAIEGENSAYDRFYEEFEKKFEIKNDKYKSSGKRTNASGSTCDNSIKKYSAAIAVTHLVNVNLANKNNKQ